MIAGCPSWRIVAAMAVALLLIAPPAGADQPKTPTLEPIRVVDLGPDHLAGVPLTPYCDRAIVMRAVTYVNVWEVAAYYWPEATTTLGAILAIVAFMRLIRIKSQARVPGEPYCRKCNYRLTALLSNRCPECGTVITPKTRLIAKSAKTRVAAWLVILAAGASAWPILWAAHPNRQPQIAQRWEWQSTGLAKWIAAQPSSPWLGMIKKGRQLVEINLETGNVAREFWPARSFQRCVISPDGKSLLASSDYRIDRWDLTSGRHLAAYTSPIITCYPCVNDFTMDDKYVYATADDNKIVRWDAQTEELV